MNAKECIMGRRSIRSFTDSPVSHELISEIVETASYAPSWKHTQIVRYIAVEGDLKDQVAKCTSAYPHNGEIIASAPMVIAVTIIKGRSGYERDGSFSTHRGEGWQMYDAGVASQTFCLAAHEAGLGHDYADDDALALGCGSQSRQSGKEVGGVGGIELKASQLSSARRNRVLLDDKTRTGALQGVTDSRVGLLRESGYVSDGNLAGNGACNKHRRSTAPIAFDGQIDCLILLSALNEEFRVIALVVHNIDAKTACRVDGHLYIRYRHRIIHI